MATLLDPKLLNNSKENEFFNPFKKVSIFDASRINNFMHSELPVIGYNSITPSIKGSLDLHKTKNFVVSINKLKDYCEIDVDYSFESLKEKFVEVSSFISELSPDSLSFSLTNENSTFFIFRIREYEFHLNYFFNFDPLDDDDDEAIFTFYENGGKKESFGGSLSDIKIKLKSILNLHPFAENSIISLQEMWY